MSAVLPVAERMLIEQRELQPFGCTLSTNDDIARVGFSGELDSDPAELLTHFHEAFRDGARRAELKATALVHTRLAALPGAEGPERAVLVELDHRDDYSVVVSFPYHFTDSAELVIEEPFAAEGKHAIFAV